MKSTEMVSPAEMALIRERLLHQQREMYEAADTLATIRAATEDLRRLLDSPDVDENDLQNCLTQNPVLFGGGLQAIDT